MIDNPQTLTDQVLNLAEKASEVARAQQTRINSIEQSIPTVSDTYNSTSSNAMSGKAVASAVSGVTLAGLGGVPTTRTINSKALSANITLTASDVGALPSDTTIPTITDTYSSTSSDGMSGKAVASAISGVTLSGLGGVPTTRTINSKALSGNISLTASDVGALPSTTSIPTITDTYSSTSSDGMSGKAVASAIAKTKKTAFDTIVTSAGVVNVNTYYASNTKDIVYSGLSFGTGVTQLQVKCTTNASSDAEFAVFFTAGANMTLSITSGTLMGSTYEITAGNAYILLIFGGKYVSLIEQNTDI